MISYNTLVVLTGTSLLGACAGVVGSYAVLRRRSLTGDALAHAALPGLCLAFLVRGERSLPWMLFGAFLSGMLGIGVIAALRRWTRIKEDAAIGIVLSVFFGAGIALSRAIQNMTVSGSKAGLDSYILGKTAGMLASDVYLIGGVSLLSLVIIVLCYKQFLVLSFDPGFAQVQGWPVYVLDLVLMGLVAITVTVGLPAVGVVLMASLLIIPGAAARFWTERLGLMLVLSGILGLCIGLGGTWLSTTFSLLPAGPLIVLTGTVVFFISLLCAPERGLLARTWREREVRSRIREEAWLRRLYDHSVALTPTATRYEWSVWSMATRDAEPVIDRIRQSFFRQQWIEPVGDEHWRWTPLGIRQAAEITYQHRMRDLLLVEHGEWIGGFSSFDGAELLRTLPADLLHELEAKLSARGRLPGEHRS